MGLSQREVLAAMLRTHGEDDLAQRTAALTDDELQRIKTLGGFYAWSEDAAALGLGMGGARAFALASVDVLENNRRDLRRHQTDQEVALGLSEPDADERERELLLRRRAAGKHMHGLPD